jgi:hypothetical protein
VAADQIKVIVEVDERDRKFNSVESDEAIVALTNGEPFFAQ